MDFKISGLNEKRFTLKQVCKKSNLPQGPLISADGLTKVDCMGETVDVNKFCEKTFPTPELLRGLANSVDKEVVCQKAKMAVLTIICDERDKKLCSKPKQSCESLRSKFARRHKLYHSALVERSQVDQLKCYYTSDAGQNSKSIDL